MAERRRDDQRKLLAIYLNDHLMAATGGVELARRAVRSNAGSRFGPPLEELLTEIVEDRATLLRLMRAHGVGASRVKGAAATVGEWAGRLKLNGRITTYSPLSRVVELEALHAGVTFKLRLWRTLEHIGGGGSALSVMELDRLIVRGESQLERIEGLRLDAAAVAFRSSSP